MIDKANMFLMLFAIAGMAGCATSGQKDAPESAASINSEVIVFDASGRRDTARDRSSVAESLPRGGQLSPRWQTSPCDGLAFSIRKAYVSFRYDEVIHAAEALLAHPQATHTQQAEAYALTGAAWYMNGNTAAAKQCFRRIREIMPFAALNRKVFPESVLMLFDEAETESDVELTNR